MRFIEHGPDIPDELLLALDEGKVMFFCGAGVSQAYAGLPNFLELTKTVLKELGVTASKPAYKILKSIPEIDKQTGVSGLISLDRVFGELEKTAIRENKKTFAKRDIESIVAKALRTPKDVDLTAHRILLDLSTTTDGCTRLVTTNFDRLFEEYRTRRRAKKLKTWQRPRFPNPDEMDTFDGVVYLHGMVNEKYNGSDNSFVLSSASFGDAYLTEGSATRFFKEIISKYTVVFVGYAADDPPVRYLLEALGEGKRSSESKKIYAFQSGTSQEAFEKWDNKNAEAIACDNHDLLWDTLDAWAKRAKNLTRWQDKIIAMARKGPENLLPFEREQVSHLVSSKKGAHRFCESKNPPPATWLCVFDSARRLVVPTTMLQENGDEIEVAPFERYGLAMDPDPESIDLNNNFIKQDMRTNPWDAFDINDQDKLEGQGNLIVQMRGYYALSVGELPKRLEHLGAWIAEVSDQNAAIWWAVRQAGIHWRVQDKIRRSLRYKTNPASHIVQAWHYLFDSWQSKSDDRNPILSGWYSFEGDLKKFDWDMAMVRRYEDLTKPRMVPRPSYYRGVIAPQKNVKTDFRQLIELDISYSSAIHGIEIPDKCLTDITAVWKRNLDMAIYLEKEKGYYFSIRPLIIPTDGQDTSGIRASDNLTNIVFYYTYLLERWLKYKPQQAQAHIKAWDNDDDNVYARLRIWACQFPELVPNKELGQFFATMSRYFFWNSAHQHDLLFTLKTCWSRMPVPAKQAIGRLLLQGYEKPEGQEEQKYILYRARRVLLRLVWLKENDCVLDIDYDKEMALLQKDDPEFKPEYTKSVDRSTDGLVHRVISKTDPSVLCGLPFSEILDKSEKEINRHDDFSVEHDPFAGLCETQPVHAFAVLRYEAKQGNHRAWAWRKFLYREGCKDDSERMKRFIAEILARLPDEVAVQIIHALANWTSKASEQLTLPCVPVFERLTKRLVKIMQENHKHEDLKTEPKNSDHDWNMYTINSPLGYLAEALFNDPRIKKLKTNQSPPPNWINLAKDMLDLPDDLGRYALLTFTYRLGWFYQTDPQWTHDNLLQPLFDGNPDTTEAWWGGYLWGVRYLPTPELFKKIKFYLLKRASNQGIQTRHDSHMMPQFILSNWGYGDEDKKRISDSEFRDILLNAGDDFRSKVLWQVETFCKEDASPPHWNKKRLALLEKVWPREILAKTPQTSERLIQFAFSDESAFPRLTKAIIPLLGEIKQGHVFSILHGAEENCLIDKHPERVLEILYKVLPQNANQWPYEIEKVVDRIATADPELKHDPRFKELQRRWAAR